MYKLMKRIYLLLSLLLCSLLCMSQVSTSQNYISTRTYTSPDHSGCREQVVYFDGLGRPSQTVDCGITPDRKDLVSLQEYDDQGRQVTHLASCQVSGKWQLYAPFFLTKWCKLIGRW